MASEFRLPDIGEGLHEAEIVRWLVKAGDTVAEDQPMVEVQTDKAIVEIPSPFAGTVLKLHADEGDIVPVGDVMITIGAAGGAPAEAAPDQSPAEAPAVPAEAAEAPAPAPAAETAGAPRRRPLASPATRRLARELGVDLAEVQGTGPAGRIMDADVKAFAEAPAAADTPAPAPAAPAVPATPAPAAADPAETPAAPPVPPSLTAAPGLPAEEDEERVPLRGLRRRIAERMVLSKTTVPHVTHMDEVDVTDLVAMRKTALPLAEQRGVKLTYLPFIIKAVVAGLKEHPYMNSSLDDEADEIILKKHYHIGIATDTDDGLMVPVIKHADRKSILDIAAEIDYLAHQARTRKIELDHLRGSTFTITNVGALGGVFSTPVINHPEAAILGVHRIRQRPAVVDGEIVPRHMLTLGLSFDHRVADGATAARFLNQVMGYLQQPSLLFMEMI